MDKEHLGFWYHKIANMTVVEIHDGSDAIAVFGAQDGFRGTTENIDKIGKVFGSVFGRRLSFVFAVFFEFRVDCPDNFLQKVEPHDIIYYIIKEL